MPRRDAVRRPTAARIAVAASLAFVAGFALAAPGSAVAGQNYFAAIAANKAIGTYGYAFDQLTRPAAEARALAECQDASPTHASQCQTYVWVRNGCAALAARERNDGSLSRIAWGIGNTKRKAKQRALEAGGPRTSILAWVCTNREPPAVRVTGRTAFLACQFSPIVTRPSNLPIEGVWTDSMTAGQCAADTTASQTSDVEAAADGNDWLDVQESMTSNGATNTQSQHFVDFTVKDQPATLSCTGSFTAANTEGGFVLWLDQGTPQEDKLVTATASQGVDVSRSLGAGTSHNLRIATGGLYPSASSHITCDFDGKVAIG